MWPPSSPGEGLKRASRLAVDTFSIDRSRHDLDDGHSHAFTMKLCIRALLTYLNHGPADAGSASYTPSNDHEELTKTYEFQDGDNLH